MNSRTFARAADALLDGDVDMHNISQVENPALQDNDSKDSQLLLKDDVSKVCQYKIQLLDNQVVILRIGITMNKTLWRWMPMMNPIRIQI